MNYRNAKGRNFSVLSLGTVQLGMAYGLDNDGKPSEKAAFGMLDRAMELGVNTLDTANNYGDSEAIIGRWLEKRRRNNLGCPTVITKIGSLTHGSFDALRSDVLRQVDASRANLGQDTLDCLMLHDFEDYDRDRDALRKIFEELKVQGACRLSAISAYSRHDYGVIAASGFDAVQIPLNVFDWSQIRSGGLRQLVDAGMAVFTRSVFLQGLVFHTPENLDPHMAFCAPYLAAYHALCRELQLSPAVLALSFVLSLPGVTSAVLGCQNQMQVEANCALIQECVQLTNREMERIRAAFETMDPRVINPGVWFNAAK